MATCRPDRTVQSWRRALFGFSMFGHAKTVTLAQNFFADIGNATYIAFTSNRNVVGFQLNGSNDGRMLDGLPALN